MDTLATITMKNAAKRDINCELQNSVNHHNFERILESKLCFDYASLSIVKSTHKKKKKREKIKEDLCLFFFHFFFFFFAIVESHFRF